MAYTFKLEIVGIGEMNGRIPPKFRWRDGIIVPGQNQRTFWKISVHSTTMAAGAVLFWLLFDSPAFFLGVPVITWSRLRLQRHTLSRTIAGAALGSVLFGPYFLINGG